MNKRMMGAVLTLAGSTGCIGLVGNPPDVPSSLGEHAVGVTTMTVTDPRRERTFDVEVWYPSAANVPEDVEAELYAVYGMGGIVARLRSAASAKRDVEPERGTHPIVLISHGSGSTRFGNVTLAEILASHGYVVAAPDHPGHTMDEHVLGISDAARARATLDRQLDMTRLLDVLTARSKDPRFELTGALDFARVAVAGHSFGGTTALGMVGAQFDGARQKRECAADPADRLCEVVAVLGSRPYRYRDERVRAAVLIAPGGFDLYRADGIAKVDAPTLVVGADRDRGNPWDEYPQPTYDALTSPRYLLALEDAGHLTATDICRIVDSIGFLAKAFGGEDAVDGCGGPNRGFVSTTQANDEVAEAMLAFLDVHLNGDASAEPRLLAALDPQRPSRTRVTASGERRQTSVVSPAAAGRRVVSER